MLRALNVSVLIAVIALVVPCAQADDGMTITSKVTAAMGGASTSTQYITSDKIRISDGKTDMIVDLKAGKMIQIDHKKKKYFEITFEEMRQHFEKMEQMIASTPMMEKMMGTVKAAVLKELEIPDEEMFRVEKKSLDFSEYAPVCQCTHPIVICESCKEAVFEPYIRIKKGKNICMECAGEQYGMLAGGKIAMKM